MLSLLFSMLFPALSVWLAPPCPPQLITAAASEGAAPASLLGGSPRVSLCSLPAPPCSPVARCADLRVGVCFQFGCPISAVPGPVLRG